MLVAFGGLPDALSTGNPSLSALPLSSGSDGGGQPALARKGARLFSTEVSDVPSVADQSAPAYGTRSSSCPCTATTLTGAAGAQSGVCRLAATTAIPAISGAFSHA